MSSVPRSTAAAMVSHPPSDRHPNVRTGAANGHGKAERTPGTPRKDGGAGKDKGVQDPGLRDYVRHPHAPTRKTLAYTRSSV